MKVSINKYWTAALTLLFGAAVFLFWRFGYPFALTYQEQFQLFLFDSDYLAERICLPGGAADVLAEFIVQFFNSITLGALLLAALYMLLQRLSWRLMKRHGAQPLPTYPLSFIPPVLVWFLMGDVNTMLAFTVALTLALGAMLACPKASRTRMVYLLIGIPLLYWAAGSVVLVLVLYVAIDGMTTKGNRIAATGIGLAAFVYAVACIIASSHMVPYPLTRLFYGLFYYRFPVMLPYAIVATAAVAAILPFVGKIIPAVTGKRHRYIWLAAGIVLLLGGGTALIRKGFDAKTYELLEYDYLVRINNWDGIIAKAEKQSPDLPMSVCATNLALGMKGQLGDRAFQFYQNGIQGLLPDFERNFTTLLVSAEAYYQLGLINTAQRFDFESMESLPNYKKSGRIMKRLAETNLINGQYRVAEKYLNLLGKTLFYSKWANRTKALLGNEKAINAHPLYGRLRRLRLQEDFLFSQDERDKILGQLLMHNKDNQLAMQYLLLYPLLDRDINKFMNYMMFADKLVSYNPQTCQEAIAFAYMTKNEPPPQGYVSPMVVQNMMEFGRIVQQQGKNAQQLGAYRNTVWYYLMDIGK